MNIRDQVGAFHEKFGVPVRDTPTVPDDHEVRFRARLIAEEFFETMEALFGRHVDFYVAKQYVDRAINERGVQVDLVEVTDGLADLDYVIEGARLTFGIDGEPIAVEVHRSNMAKEGGAVREDGKITKPEGWQPPDIKGELRMQGWDPKRK